MELRYHTHFKKNELENNLNSLSSLLPSNSFAIISIDNHQNIFKIGNIKASINFNLLGLETNQIEALIKGLSQDTIEQLYYQDLDYLTKVHNLFPLVENSSSLLGNRFITIYKNSYKESIIKGYDSFITAYNSLKNLVSNFSVVNKEEGIYIFTLGIRYIDFLSLKVLMQELNCKVLSYQSYLDINPSLISKNLINKEDFFSNKYNKLEIFNDLGQNPRKVDFYNSYKKIHNLYFPSIDPITLVIFALEANLTPSYKYQRSSQQAANALTLSFLQNFQQLGIIRDLNNLEAKFEYCTKKNGAHCSYFAIKSIKLENKQSYNIGFTSKDTDNKLLEIAQDFGLMIFPSMVENPIKEKSSLDFINKDQKQSLAFLRENFSLLEEGITIVGQAYYYNKEAKFARSYFLNNVANNISLPHKDNHRNRGNKITSQDKELNSITNTEKGKENTLTLDNLPTNLNEKEAIEYKNILEVLNIGARALRKEITWKQIIVSIVFNLYNQIKDTSNLNQSIKEVTLPFYIKDIYNLYKVYFAEGLFQNISLEERLEIFELKKNSKHLLKLYSLASYERANPPELNQETLAWNSFVEEAFAKIESTEVIKVENDCIILQLSNLEIRFSYLNKFPLDKSIFNSSIKESNIIYLEVESQNKLLVGDSYLISSDDALRSNFTIGIPLELPQLNQLFNKNNHFNTY